jgi:hypothetical protein
MRAAPDQNRKKDIPPAHHHQMDHLDLLCLEHSREDTLLFPQNTLSSSAFPLHPLPKQLFVFVMRPMLENMGEGFHGNE